MHYRITIDMIFTTPDPISDIVDKLHDHQAQAVTINPGTQYAEHSHWTSQLCEHDIPPQSCQITGHWQSP